MPTSSQNPTLDPLTPVWGRAERHIASVVVAVLSWGIAGLVLALVGWFHWWTVLPATLLIWYRLRALLPAARGVYDGWWRAMVIAAIALAIVNSALPGEHLLGGRDSGTYLATAGWLAQEGTIFVDAGSGAFGEYDELEYFVPGFYDRGGDGNLEPQFMHAYPAMLGTLIDIGGVRLGLGLNAVIASLTLLALFALARRFMASWAGGVAVGTLALSLVFTYYARTPFSEMTMALFVVTGIWLLGVAEERLDSSLGLLAGIALGAATLVRLDGLVLLLPAAAYLQFAGARQQVLQPVMRRARLGMFLTAFVAIAESLLVSPAYVLRRSDMVVPVLFALLIVMVAGDLFSRGLLRNLRSAAGKAKRALFVGGVVLAGLLLTYGWFVRPIITESSRDGYALASLQEREGLEIDESRDYAENSVLWITWYQGPAFVVLAFVGAALLLYRQLFSASARSGWLVVGVLATFAVLYLWRPSINPDHIWAMRRYMTVVLPLAAVAAGLALESLTRWLSDSLKFRQVAWLGGVSLSILLLFPPMVTTAPVWNLRELSGLAADYSDLCETVSNEDYILFLGNETAEARTYAQGFRSFCGIKTAWNGGALSDADLTQLNAAVVSEGGRLILADREGPGLGEVVFSGPYKFLELTLSRPPSRTENLSIPLLLTFPVAPTG